MKHTVAAIGSIATILIPPFFYFKHTTLAVICVCIGISSAIIFAWLSIKNRNLEKNKVMPKPPMGVGTDENTRLVIKAICDESDGFVTFNDIVRDTNLPLKTINKALDWLFINKFATETKGRSGKIYALTPEGKSVFSKLINEYLDVN